MVRILQAAENGIFDIGKAKLGDKTLIDTLSPAVRSLEKSEKAGRLLPEALEAFKQAAKEGMASTKDMLVQIASRRKKYPTALPTGVNVRGVRRQKNLNARSKCRLQ